MGILIRRKIFVVIVLRIILELVDVQGAQVSSNNKEKQWSQIFGTKGEQKQQSQQRGFDSLRGVQNKKQDNQIKRGKTPDERLSTDKPTDKKSGKVTKVLLPKKRNEKGDDQAEFPSKISSPSRDI